MACQHCRRKRAKCDGKEPCERCSRSGRQCLFSSSQRESKDALRAEIERLRRKSAQSDALVDALSSGFVDAASHDTIWPTTTATETSISDPMGRTSWHIPYITRLLDQLAICDPIPFCLVDRDLFLSDLSSGHTRYSSPALANILVALGTRIVLGSDAEADACYEVAWAALRCSPSSISTACSLADGQALGVLALYLLVVGREAEAWEMAGGFVTAMARLRGRKSCLVSDYDGGDEQYNGVVATSHCGALFLARILRMSCPRPKNSSGLDEADLLLDHSPLPGQKTYLATTTATNTT
ncbi:nitrate assimilation regulatory protein nirA [Ophiocordyceps camponoti-floridani]|uniref:Nitrate assimilation regulatory protein nirA n=1 Tax=Ophiocordyceps camponoti-floridani TaxID=2030778 RepID=A0A8H4VDQ2_9HYPO|nr:nitrate assimilation regulatory protein nirA [Ophiocordyceps camponoti-floridani]